MADPVSPVVKGLEMFELTFGGERNNQPEYKPLPMLRGNGCVTSRWSFTAKERQAIAMGGDVLISLWTGGVCPPQRIIVTSPDEELNPNAMAELLQLVVR